VLTLNLGNEARLINEVAKNVYSPGSPSWPGLYAFMGLFLLEKNGLRIEDGRDGLKKFGLLPSSVEHPLYP
jgi:hypothetical protein